MEKYYSMETIQQAALSLSTEIGTVASQKFLDYLSEVPSANVRPIVPAKWIKTSNKSDRCMCSKCFHYFGDLKVSEYEFCPKCGATITK